MYIYTSFLLNNDDVPVCFGPFSSSVWGCYSHYETMRPKHLRMFGCWCVCVYTRAEAGCIVDDVTNENILSSCKNTSIWLLVSTCFNPSQKYWPMWIATQFQRLKKHWNHQATIQDPSSPASPSWNELLPPPAMSVRNPDLRTLLPKQMAEFKPLLVENQITWKPTN